MINGLEDTFVNEEISSLGHVRAMSKGQSVFREDESADFLPLILEGRIKVFRSAGFGKEVILNIFEKGDLFAIPPVFDGKTYPASAMALEDSKVLCLSRDDFMRLLSRSPEFSAFIFSRMSALLRETTQFVKILAYNDPQKRIASVLIWIASKYDAMPCTVQLRRQDIAEIAGIATETAIRHIRSLSEKDLVKIEGGKIIVDDLPALKSFVNV